MEHMDYDISLVIGSIVLAVIICFFAISLEQLIFKQRYERYQTLILIVSGLLLGLAIWSMHFLGMLACHLPGDYHFDPG
ncbi:MAG: MHYT domain-containing protein, partial [Acidimicrobiales bacterium]